MKSIFQSIFTALQRKKPRSRKPGHVIIWRESVAAGDDVDAPHELEVKVEQNEPIDRTVEKILANRYLASIQGGKATWILMGRKPIAVLAQQWSKPHFLVEPTTCTEELIASTGDRQFEFLYWCQVEPHKVVDCIVQGKPWPDRYSGNTQE